MPAPDCLTQLDKIFAAITALQSGQTVTSISFGERSVAYSSAQLNDLIGLYRSFWTMCGRGTAYPDLSAAARVERGPPARFSMF